MVSKVAVIALVAIVATPILLGFALNLTEQTYTKYEVDNNPVNVTQLLWNGVAYTYTSIDAYHLNTNLAWLDGMKSIPHYNTITSNVTSYPLVSEYTSLTAFLHMDNLDYPYIYLQYDYSPTYNLQGKIYGMVGGSETVIDTIDYIHSIYYENTSNEYYGVSFDGDSQHFESFSGTGELTKITINTSIYPPNAKVYRAYYSNSSYADFSGGFYFEGQFKNYAYYPKEANTGLFTINLDSITDPNYTADLLKTGRTLVLLKKTTTPEGVSWQIKDPLDSSVIFDLYYDPSRNDNTYQVYFELEQVESTPSINNYILKIEFRYVGSWPTVIGEANTFIRYTMEDEQISAAVNDEQPFIYLGFGGFIGDRSPTLRIDSGTFGSMKYNVMEDKEYQPGSFRTNPSTTITNVNLYGSSLSFGGNTYPVTNGNITLGTHSYSVTSLVFDSVPTISGYQNRINGHVISTSANPSTITFGGKWSADIKTDSMTGHTVTETEWIPGHFAWDGMDDNFLMVGLLTSLAAFIGLGIYSRRSKFSVWPLMIVTGGAAFLFLILM